MTRSKNFSVDFLGIGPAKAGTTWVGHMLEAHPQVCMAEPKEVHFFNDSLSNNKTYSKSHFPLGFDWYAKHFKHATAGQIIGEVTTRYFLDPVVPKRVYDMNPATKLIVCLRNPFERIVSQYHSIRDFHHAETRPLSQALREDPEYIGASLHFLHVSDFMQYFPLSQIHFVDMERIKRDPESEVAALYGFLGVDHTFIPSNLRQKSNPARATRFTPMRQATNIIHRQMVSLGFSSVVRKLKVIGVGKVINRLNSKPIQKARLTEEDKNYIRKHLTEDVKAFSALIGKDYTHWLQ